MTTKAALEALTRPIIGIENRTAQEAFDIMSDRIRSALSTPDAGCAIPEGWRLVPKEPEHQQIRAMAESQASDDEGVFQTLGDLIGYSGENKTRTVLKAAYRAMLASSPTPPTASDTGWRDGKQDAMVHGKPFLAWNDDLHEFIAEWFDGIGYVFTFTQQPCTFRLWQPLPAPPQGQTT